MFLSSAVWYQLDFLVALTTGLYLTSGFTPRYLPRVVDPLDLPKNVVSKLHFPSVQHTNDLRKDVKRRLRRGIILSRRRSTCRVPGGKSIPIQDARQKFRSVRSTATGVSQK